MPNAHSPGPRAASSGRTRGVVAAGAVALCLLASGCGVSGDVAAAQPLGRAPAPGTPAPGAPLPVPPSSGPHVTKVLTVVEENHSLDQMRSSMPYLSSVAATYGYATGYHAIRHPSLPNYLAITGGSTFGVTDDAYPILHPVHGASVFGQALSMGRTARVYAESMPANCALENWGRYAVRHTGWAYYVDERKACKSGLVPLGDTSSGALADDIASGSLPDVGLVVPDLGHDAHNGTLGTADAWLRDWLPPILSGPDFRSGHLAVVITADEDDRHADNSVLTVVATPSVQGRVVTAGLTHYSLTGFYDDAIGAPRLRGAGTAPSLAAAFGIPVGP